MTQIDTDHDGYFIYELVFIGPNYYLLLITYYLLLITYILPSFPSPDRNGYPTAWVGEWVGLSVGVHGREEYEWIAGNSS